MNIPYSLEQAYLLLTTKRSFSSGKEDEFQITQDLHLVSEFFSQTSRKQSEKRVEDLTINKLLNLMSAYRGPEVRHHRIRFIDDAVS